MRQFAKSIVSKAPILRPFAANLDYVVTGHKNLLYDVRTVAIMKRVLKPASNVVDVGTHNAEVLRYALGLCPHGRHYAFEPLPEYASKLRASLPECVTLCEVALSDSPGKFTFFQNFTDSSRSGLKRTRYDEKHQVEQIQVRTSRMDDILPADYRVDLIKIDVEGAEFLVLKGAMATLRRWHPLVILEHGLGAADEAYGCKPEDLHDLMIGLGYGFFTLLGFLKQAGCLSSAKFASAFRSGREYYWVAVPHSMAS
jgi:FkbM family methyltransferase